MSLAANPLDSASTDDPASQPVFDFAQAPGHLIRRAHQWAVSIFAEEVAGLDITPMQFAVLKALLDEPGLDQVTLAAHVAFDAATSGAVLARLEAKGRIRREPDPKDRRRRRLWLTDEGRALLLRSITAVSRAQDRIVCPMAQIEAKQLAGLLRRLIDGHEEAATGHPPSSGPG